MILHNKTANKIYLFQQILELNTVMKMWVGLIILKETYLIEALKTTSGDNGVKT